MSFLGYPSEGLAFLAELSEHNDRDWYRANAQRYHRAVLDPTRDFVVELGARLRERIAPDIRSEPKVHRGIRALSRDTRFSQDKTPYRTAQGLTLGWGADRGCPSFWLEVGPVDVGFGAGEHGWGKERLAAWRAALDDPDRGPALDAVLEGARERGFELAGAGVMKSPPRGFPADHPRAGLLKYRTGVRLQRRLAVDPQDGPALVEACVSAAEVCAPLVRWLSVLEAPPDG